MSAEPERSRVPESIVPRTSLRRSVPAIEPPAPSLTDTKDEDEALAFSDQRNLEKEKARAEHERSQRFHNHLGLGVICGLWAAIIGVLAMGFCWLYHLVVPVRLHFLTIDQLGDIKTVLFGGGVGAFVNTYLGRMMAARGK